MSDEHVGRTRWALAEDYIPGWSHGPAPQMVSHETICVLNTGPREAHVRLTVYFRHRKPAGPYALTVPARRTRHLRLNELRDPEPIPHDKDFATVVESDVPVVVQQSRLDSRQAQNALLSTIAYPAD